MRYTTHMTNGILLTATTKKSLNGHQTPFLVRGWSLSTRLVELSMYQICDMYMWFIDCVHKQSISEPHLLNKKGRLRCHLASFPGPVQLSIACSTEKPWSKARCHATIALYSGSFSVPSPSHLSVADEAWYWY